MKKSIFSWIIAAIIAVTPTLANAQKAAKGKADTIAQFVIVKKSTDVDQILTQLQQSGQPVAAEGAWYTETRKGELIPLKDGEDHDKKHARLVLMNWGDLPSVSDTGNVENRIRGFFDLDHPFVHPINGGKDGYQMEMIVIRNAPDKDGVKPIYGFLDLKKTLANQLKDGTTYQVLVSIADTANNKKKIFKNLTSYYYSAGEKNFSIKNPGNRLLVNCVKIIPVRIHWVKLNKRDMFVDAKPDDRGAKYIVSAWGDNTMLNPASAYPMPMPEYHLPVANK